MRTKRTQGPWKVKPSESKPAFNVVGTHLGGKYKIARCPYTVLSDGNSYDKEEAEADAIFIATAPEMFELLKELYCQTEAVDGRSMEKAFDLLDWLQKEGRPRIFEMIAKATGKKEVSL